jgi:hypothetical protein
MDRDYGSREYRGIRGTGAFAARIRYEVIIAERDALNGDKRISLSCALSGFNETNPPGACAYKSSFQCGTVTKEESIRGKLCSQSHRQNRCCELPHIQASQLLNNKGAVTAPE